MVEFNAKNRFHVREDQCVKNLYERYSINISEGDVPLPESLLWPFANCVPRTVILHEHVLPNGSMTYNYVDDASWGVLMDIQRFTKNLPKDWEPHKPSFMRRNDKMFYEMLLKELTSGTVSSYENIDATPTCFIDSRVLIKRFFIEFFEYPMRVADYYKENYFDKNPGSEKEPLKIPAEIRHDAAMACRLTGLPFKMSRNFPLKKRYKFLKLKGEFDKIGYNE